MTVTLTTALELFLTALLTVFAKFLISFVNSKIQEAKVKTQNDILNKYLDMINKTIADCVIATNQTYVESLKNKDMFDASAQKEAFNMTLTSVKTLLTDEAIIYLQTLTDDTDLYLQTLIEAEVNKNKGSK